jgi:hypothetical protein
LKPLCFLTRDYHRIGKPDALRRLADEIRRIISAPMEVQEGMRQAT